MVRFRLAVLALLATFTVLVPAAPAHAATSVAGGDVLTSASGFRCQLGFNLSGRGILAAASCGPVGTQWYSGPDLIGTTVVQTKTASLIYITNPAVTQIAGRRIGGGAIAPVSSAARAFVGQTVSYHSWTLGTRTGTVTGVNQTINYAGGSITGLDRTTLCAGSRDPGSPVVAGSVGLSIIFGGSTSCSGGAVFAQPITPLLAAWGRTLY
jgi:streptogrisin D